MHFKLSRTNYFSVKNLKKILTSLTFIAAYCFSIGAQAAPNIMLIVIDDVGMDRIGAYQDIWTNGTTTTAEDSNSLSITPNLDALAADETGMLFSRVWTHPQCSPARAAILTGRHGFRNGVTHPGGTGHDLDLSEHTMAEYLAGEGYKTAMYGKWHLGEEDTLMPAEQGFDEFIGTRGSIDGSNGDYFDFTETVYDPVADDYTDTTHNVTPANSGSNYAPQMQVDDAISWINGLAAADEWFLYLPLYSVHSPFHVPPTDLFVEADYNLTGESTGQRCSRNQNTPAIEDCFKAMVHVTDYLIQDLIDGIPADERDDTVIFIIGDNGSPATSITTVVNEPWDTNKAKGTIYEGGVRVPLITWAGPTVGLYDDNNATAVNQIDEMVQGLDIFNTVIELVSGTAEAAVDFPTTGDYFDSQSIYDTLANNNVPTRTEMYTEMFRTALGVDMWAQTTGVAKYLYDVEQTGNEDQCYRINLNLSNSNLEETADLWGGTGAVGSSCTTMEADRYCDTNDTADTCP